MKTSEKKKFMQLTDEERKFIENYRKLSEEEKKDFVQMINDKSQMDFTD